jgi:hypothetical protein
VGAQFGQAQARGVQAGLAGTSIVVVVGDIFQSGGLQSRILHAPDFIAAALWIVGV